MTNEERTVLHILPHPGGGGETYVDSLTRMDGYRFERVYLAPSQRITRAAAALPSGVARALLTSRQHDLVHVHGEVAAALALPSLATRPSVVTLHGLHLMRRLHGVPGLTARANLRLLSRTAKRIICVSEAEYADLARVAGPGAVARAVVIHNGVAPAEPVSREERIAARGEFGISPVTTVGAFIGSLDAHKDPLAAVRAAIIAAGDDPQLTLLVAGEGPLRPEVERAAREVPGVVRVLGFRSDTRRVLAAADFFVLPSRREGLSYSLLEAMSLGLPSVVSDAPGNPEAIGQAGIVVGRGDVAGFVSALVQLTMDVPRRRVLGKHARERALGHFRLDEMLLRTRRVYDEVAGERSSGSDVA